MQNTTILDLTGSAMLNNVIGSHHRPANLQRKLAAIKYQPVKSHDQAAAQAPGNFRLIAIFSLLLVLLAGCIYLIAGYAGAEIARAGHTINTGERRIIINSDIITAPANIIRYPSQRRLVEAKRLDLYLHWPSMEGYSEKLKSEFNDLEDNSKIIFVSLTPRFSTYDMTARIKPIYQKFFTSPAVDIGYGLESRELDAKAGFIDEYLIVQKNSSYPFSARCVRATGGSPIPYCIRDIHIGKDISLTYRFHKDLIADWLALDQAVRSKFKAMIN